MPKIKPAEDQHFTVEEYLAYEAEAGIRYEYIDGYIFAMPDAMSGGTERHSLITTNCIIAVGQQLRDRNCRVYNGDMRVKISDTRYLYPDFSVVCGEAAFADQNHTMLTNPVLVAEVMSPSSADYDRGTKGEFYRSLPSVQAYLLFDQDRAYAQLYTRHEGKTGAGWLLRDFHGLNQTIPLDALNISLPLSEAYRNITLP